MRFSRSKRMRTAPHGRPGIVRAAKLRLEQCRNAHGHLCSRQRDSRFCDYRQECAAATVMRARSSTSSVLLTSPGEWEKSIGQPSATSIAP